MTDFSVVYDRFLGKITDDMYLEWTEQDTRNDLYSILMDAIPGFEFPRKTLTYTDTSFDEDLTSEEINILAILMMNAWLQRQITSVENIRMKYSGSDFKMTSQANHLAKLLTLRAETERQSMHMQRLYKRRKTEEGYIKSNWSILRQYSALDDNEV